MVFGDINRPLRDARADAGRAPTGPSPGRRGVRVQAAAGDGSPSGELWNIAPDHGFRLTPRPQVAECSDCESVGGRKVEREGHDDPNRAPVQARRAKLRLEGPFADGLIESRIRTL